MSKINHIAFFVGAGLCAIQCIYLDYQYDKKKKKLLGEYTENISKAIKPKY